jgi:hypothetical protein
MKEILLLLTLTPLLFGSHHWVVGGEVLKHFEGYAYDANGIPTSSYTVYVKRPNGTTLGTATPNASGYWEVRYVCPGLSDQYFDLKLGSPAVGAVGGVPHPYDQAPCAPHQTTTVNLKVGDFIGM